MTTTSTTTQATTTQTTAVAGEQLVVGKSTRTTARPSGRGPEATRQHRPSARLAAQIADGRELAVLVDGPWRGRWYWRADLDAMQAAAHRYPHGHPAAELRTYQPTGQFVAHPHEPDIEGRAWRHHPRPAPSATIWRNP